MPVQRKLSQRHLFYYILTNVIALTLQADLIEQQLLPLF